MSDRARAGLITSRLARYTLCVAAIALPVLLCGGASTPQADQIVQKEFEAQNDRSAALNAQGKFAEALEAAEKALELNPGYSFAWNNKCVALIGLGKHPEALEAADSALQADPLNAVAWTNKALVYRQSNQLDEALRAMDRAILVDGNNPLIWYNKACYQALKKDVNGAIKSLSRALELEPRLKPVAAKEPDFEVVKEDPEFKKILSK